MNMFIRSTLVISLIVFSKSTLAAPACCDLSGTCTDWKIASAITKAYCENHSGKYYVGQECSGDKCEKPTLVDLGYFRMEVNKNYITFNWETSSEHFNAEFNILCANESDGYSSITILNKKLIPARGNFHEGFNYSYQEPISNFMEGSATCCGLEEDIDTLGSSTQHYNDIACFTP